MIRRYSPPVIHPSSPRVFPCASPRIALCLAILLLVQVFPAGTILQAQEGDEEMSTANPSSEEIAEMLAPRPYEREEFPQWAWDLRRGEIIAFGAYPIAMIVSGISLQLGRFAIASIQDRQFSQEYAPFFLSTRTGPRYDEQERVGLLVSAGIISAGVALADYFLGRREARRTEQ